MSLIEETIAMCDAWEQEQGKTPVEIRLRDTTMKTKPWMYIDRTNAPEYAKLTKVMTSSSHIVDVIEDANLADGEIVIR